MLSPQIQIASKHQFPTLENASTDANRTIRLSYGLGWGLYWCPYGEAFFKEGHDNGFRNYAVVFEKPKDGILILTNSSNGEGIFKELLETLLHDTFTPIEWEGFTPYNELPPRKPLPKHTEVTLDPKQLDRLTGRYAFRRNSLAEDAPHAGRTHRCGAGIEHHERQPPVAFQRVLQMEPNNGLLLAILQPHSS